MNGRPFRRALFGALDAAFPFEQAHRRNHILSLDKIR